MEAEMAFNFLKIRTQTSGCTVSFRKVTTRLGFNNANNYQNFMRDNLFPLIFHISTYIHWEKYAQKRDVCLWIISSEYYPGGIYTINLDLITITFI